MNERWSLIMLTVIAILTGIAVMPPNAGDRAGRSVWVFSPTHAKALQATVDAEKLEMQINLVASRALDVRLQSLAGSGQAGPMLVEIEIGSIGKYFRGQPADVPFYPLTERLRTSGWLGKISPARLKTWSLGGEVFGLPLDVHPVSLTYRKDLFEAAGVGIAAVKTWPQLQAACLAYQRQSSGRFALQLSAGSADGLVIMLQQRGVELIDSAGTVHLNDPRVADTLLFYAHLVAGSDRVTLDPTPGPGRWVDDLADGHVAMALTPDWAIDELRASAPQLAGKLAMRPLPLFDPADAPTASWGGTAVVIPRTCTDPDAAWEFLTKLYLSDTARRIQSRQTNILPAIADWWADPAHLAPDPLFGGQSIESLYVDLARQLPSRTVTPFTASATSALSLVLYRATSAINAGDDTNLDKQVAQWLNEASTDLQRRIALATLGQ
jgi:arabinosaccharide transport system substrate-binding protein